MAQLLEEAARKVRAGEMHQLLLLTHKGDHHAKPDPRDIEGSFVMCDSSVAHQARFIGALIQVWRDLGVMYPGAEKVAMAMFENGRLNS